LTIEAHRVAGDRGAAMYEFAVRADARLLVAGRATVILDVETTGNSR
jgi:predicted hotdog family 3-hydroxylacyl-ACP dehydratase